jgi:hypothetical protein
VVLHGFQGRGSKTRRIGFRLADYRLLAIYGPRDISRLLATARRSQRLLLQFSSRDFRSVLAAISRPAPGKGPCQDLFGEQDVPAGAAVDYARVGTSWTRSSRGTMMCQPLIVGRTHGRRGLAAEPGPRKIRAAPLLGAAPFCLLWLLFLRRLLLLERTKDRDDRASVKVFLLGLRPLNLTMLDWQ